MKIRNLKRIYTILYTINIFSVGFVIGSGNFPVIIFWLVYCLWLLSTFLTIIIGRKIEKAIKNK